MVDPRLSRSACVLGFDVWFPPARRVALGAVEASLEPGSNQPLERRDGGHAIDLQVERAGQCSDAQEEVGRRIVNGKIMSIDSS